MNKIQIISIIVMFVSVALLFLTAATHEILPHSVFEVVHKASGVMFMLFLLIHLFGNRVWIMNNLFKK